MKDLVKSVLKVFDGKQKRKLVGMMSVSYTHLTLPTICSV